MSNPYQSPSDAPVVESTLPPDARAGRTFVLILIVFNTLLALSAIGLAVAALFAWAAANLAFGTSVNEFLAFQRERRR